MTAPPRPACSVAQLGIALSLVFAAASAWAEPVTFSSGHVDIFEAEYEQVGVDPPTLHLGVHNDTGHYEPADVILEVKNAAYRSTDGLQPAIQTFLGPNAWILPESTEAADSLGVIEAGVAKVGFPDANAVTFTLVSAGAANPGKFVLFSSGTTNFTRLEANGGTVDAGSFSITTGHAHYNWGFSAPGTYTFDMRASYNDPVAGLLQSPVET